MHFSKEDTLADAIVALTKELRESREWRRELRATEARIIAAIKGGAGGGLSPSDADLKKLDDELKASSEPLAEAVKQNQL